MIKKERGECFKMKKKKCVLTLDYELFFKESGSAQVSILEPTARLLEVLQKISGKATFFVDTIYLNKLKNSDKESDRVLFNQIRSQLRDIVKSGSRIDLHLHPHWIDAYAKENSWVFPTYEHYKIGSLSSETIKTVFTDGISLLNSVANQVDKSYRVLAFRAGGWCVEPFSKLKELFLDHHIVIDSSVVSRMVLDGKVHQLDYSSIRPCTHYYFSDTIYEQAENGNFMEIPINQYHISVIEKICWKIRSRLNKNRSKVFGDGIGLRSVAPKSYFVKLLEFIKTGQDLQFTIDGYVDYNCMSKAIKQWNGDYVSLVAHPKTLSLSSLDAIERLSNDGYSFITVEDMYKDICGL